MLGVSECKSLHINFAGGASGKLANYNYPVMLRGVISKRYDRVGSWVRSSLALNRANLKVSARLSSLRLWGWPEEWISH